MAESQHTAGEDRAPVPGRLADLIDQTGRLLDAADIGLTGLREVGGPCAFRSGVMECITLARQNVETLRAWANGCAPRWDVEAEARDFLKIVAAVRENAVQDEDVEEGAA